MSTSRRNIKKIIYQFLPEGCLKNKIICLYHNLFRNSDFRESYGNGYFEFIFKDGVSIRSYYYGIRVDLMSAINGYTMKYNLKEGDIVVDGGAYLGAFTIYAAKKVGKNGKVIAFEPDTLNYKNLHNNIKLNNLNNVIILNKGLYSDNTTLKFSDTGSDSSFLFLESKNHIDDPRIIEISVVKLDDELRKLNIKKIDFIKMDIEGAEIEAIKGCTYLLKNNKVNLAIASYHIINNNPTYILLEKILSKMNYNCETTFPEHLTTYAIKK